MEIKLLMPGYKNDEEFYKLFIEDKLWGSKYISDESVWISHDIPDFPIYFHNKDNEKKEKDFLTTIRIMNDKVISLERDCFMDESFWHSLLCLYKRDFLLDLYPEIKNNYKTFKNIIIKKFDWENYIYKAILIAQYVEDNRADNKEKYYQLILQNMDMFNYIIKYEIFRNGTFLINIMDIIDETGISSKLKAKIKNRPDLGADERYGRRVIYELNKSYPIIMSPMLKKDELKKYFLKFLSYYTEFEEEQKNYKEDTSNNNQIEKKDDEKSIDILSQTDIIEEYAAWLKDNEFLDKAIAMYIPHLQGVQQFYQVVTGEDLLSITDAKKMKKIVLDLPFEYRHGKYQTALKYYVKFLEAKYN